MAAAMAMSGMDNHAKKISMEERRRLEAEEAVRPDSDDDDAEGIDDLDDVDLLVHSPKITDGGGWGAPLRTQSSEGSIGPGLNLGARASAVALGVSLRRRWRRRRRRPARSMGIGKVGEVGVSAASHAMPQFRGGHGEDAVSGGLDLEGTQDPTSVGTLSGCGDPISKMVRLTLSGHA